MPIIAYEVMDGAAALLNDVEKQVYTYTKQIPYLKIALQDFSDELRLANVPVTNKTSAVINLTAGATSLGFETIPALPSDLIDIVNLWEGIEGATSYTLMSKRGFLPHSLEGTNVSSFRIFSWNGNAIGVLPSNRDNDLKIDYLSAVFSITDENSQIKTVNGTNYLKYRTAALCAFHIGEDTTRSEKLDGEAINSRDIAIGVEIKSKQGVVTRRRPFRAGFKMRG